MVMRKFRIYDKKYNKYSEEPFYKILVSKDGKVYNSEEDEWYEFHDRYILEFSSNIFDLDENEIYAGDIVNIGSHGNYEGQVIDFVNCFKVESNSGYFYDLDKIIGNIKIISNIHETRVV